MSRRTISMPSLSNGSNSIFSSIKARSLPSRTTGIFSTMSQAGFSNSIAVMAFPSRETIRRLEQKQVRLEKEEKAESKRRKSLEHELEWIRMSPKARQSKGKARLNRYEELVNQKQEQRTEDLEIYIPPGPRLGDVVVQTKGLTKAYGDKVLYENVNFSLPKGGIVGVIGPNGAGKTTMFRMIIGKEEPDAGARKVRLLY